MGRKGMSGSFFFPTYRNIRWLKIWGGHELSTSILWNVKGYFFYLSDTCMTLVLISWFCRVVFLSKLPFIIFFFLRSSSSTLSYSHSHSLPSLCVSRATVELRYYPLDDVQRFMAKSVSFLFRNASVKQVIKGIFPNLCTLIELSLVPTWWDKDLFVVVVELSAVCIIVYLLDNWLGKSLFIEFNTYMNSLLGSFLLLDFLENLSF